MRGHGQLRWHFEVYHLSNGRSAEALVLMYSHGKSAIEVETVDGYIYNESKWHYNDVIMSMIASQITSLTFLYSTVYSGADQRKHQIFASLAFLWGIHRWPVNYPHKRPVTRKMFPFDDVIMSLISRGNRPMDISMCNSCLISLWIQMRIDELPIYSITPRSICDTMYTTRFPLT